MVCDLLLNIRLASSKCLGICSVLTGIVSSPGRFFATNELKSILAYLVLNYDIKLEDGITSVPKNLELGTTVMPDPNAKILLRRRQGV